MCQPKWRRRPSRLSRRASRWSQPRTRRCPSPRLSKIFTSQAPIRSSLPSSAPCRTEDQMADKKIIPVVMPKWGLSMQEGKVTGWLVQDGAKIKPGDQLLEVETDKIAGAVE